MKNDKNTPMTVEDKKAVETINLVFRFRNTLPKYRFTF
jgi:hypothetical protein